MPEERILQEQAQYTACFAAGYRRRIKQYQISVFLETGTGFDIQEPQSCCALTLHRPAEGLARPGFAQVVARHSPHSGC